MSLQTWTAMWSLINKTQALVTPININNPAGTGDYPNTDGAIGNLTPYRASSRVTSSGIKKTRNATLTLRCPHGLFIKNGPILTDDQTKLKYLINVQFSQPDGSGGTRFGDVFRFEIGKPSIDVNQYGVFLTLSLTATETRMREALDSEQHKLQTPQTTFINRVNNYFAHTGGQAPLIFVGVQSDIQLPNDAFLKQDWTPTEPKTSFELLNDIIIRLAQPPASGGTLTDYYYYFVTDPTATKTIRIFAEKFGNRSSGVIMDVLSPVGASAQQDQSIQTDNVKYKNVVIVRGQNGAHSLPMDYARFASDYAHAQVSAAWNALSSYPVGSYVVYNNQFFKSRGAVPPNIQPNVNPLYWQNLSTETNYTPWTNDYTQWLGNIEGLNIQIPVIPPDPYPNPPSVSDTEPANYWGFFHDMNITRANYDRPDPNNQYYNISFKPVSYVMSRVNGTIIIKKPTDIPSVEITHGFRVIVDMSALAGDWPGTSGSIGGSLLEYDELSTPGTPFWQQSKAPVLNDSVPNLERGELWKFNGITWINSWNLGDNFGTSAPFHPIKNIKNVKGPKGNQTAVEFQFNWDDNTDVRNRASRWCGFSFHFKWPRTSVTPIGGSAIPVGNLFNNSYLDFTNFDKDLTGANVGWNNGTKTENLGNLRGIAMQLRLTFRNSQNELINGMYDMPGIFWFRDLFDRVVYTRVKVRRNGEFDYIQFDAGPYAAGWQLYDNRIDQLFTLWGYTFPQNFFFKEREYTGVRFDWRFVKGGGFFWQDAYDENFFYKMAQNAEFDNVTMHLKEVASQLLYVFTLGQVDQGHYIINKSWCAIDEFRFLKDAYVSSETGTQADSRQELVYADDQFDYINLQKSIAQGQKARDQFFPQFQTLTGYGDVRMTLGETFIAQGTRVPNSPSTLICAEVSFIEDRNAFKMEVIGVKQFTAP